MPDKFKFKTASQKVDGVSFNVDHAKKIGKDAFVQSPEFAAHYPGLSDVQRHEVLGAVYDQITAAPSSPGPASNPISN